METLKLEWQLDGRAHEHSIAADTPACVGRSTDCEIVLPFATVSREHARIFREGRVFYIQNISRTNQVHLSDHVSLSEGQRASLQSGDTFKIGPVEFKVAAPQPAQQEGVRAKIICSSCGKRVNYVPNGVCSECGAPLAEGMTVYSS